MKKHFYRTLSIYAVLLIAAIYVYPTIGWMTLTPTERDARLERWKLEDSSTEERGYWSESVRLFKRYLEFDRDWVINLGLDLQGGVEMIVGIDYDNLDPTIKKDYTDRGYSNEDILKELQETVKQRIERRANEFGTKEPIIQTLGDRQIQVQLAGEKDVDRAKELILKTAFLKFQIVAGPETQRDVFKAIDDRFQGDFTKRLRRPGPGEEQVIQVPMEQIDKVREMVEEAKGVAGLIPDDVEIAFSRAPKPKEPQHYKIYVLEKVPIMTGDGLTMAVARPDDQSGAGRWQIAFGLNAEAGRRFGEGTESNIDRQMAIVLDGMVESAPNINDRITTSGVIQGMFSPEEARDLAIALNSGSLPVPVAEEQTGIVGARLGEDSIRKGVLSCAIGIVVVMVAMVAYYHVGGLIACIALVMNAVLILAALAYMGATLTLPGIAGLILTLGMAVDANVLIYERMREEMRLGKTLTAVVAGGYQHAFPAILDSNVTTIISGLVLLQFGTGPIQGFAVTLTIGIIASMFTSLTVTHAIIDFIVAKRWLTKITMLQLIPHGTKIPFLAQRKWLSPATALLVVIGLGFAFVRGEDNFGVEFTTGTNIVLNIDTDEQIGIGAIRQEIEAGGFKDATITAYEQEGVDTKNRFLIHVGEVETGSTTGTEETAPSPSVEGRVQSALASLAGNDVAKVGIEKVDMVGPAVGAHLKWNALQAVAWSTIFIIAYLWFRFELKFSVGAVVAMLHDVGITVGLLAISGREISLGVVAAILTVIGYSLNDTIIVFDRLREELKLNRGRGMSLLEIMDKAINVTLSRTVMTSTLTFLVVVVLFIFGGAVINDFAFVLGVGILVGTYSSIYVASPIVFWWQKYLVKIGPRKAEGGDDSGPSSRRRRRPRRDDGSKTDDSSTKEKELLV